MIQKGTNKNCCTMEQFHYDQIFKISYEKSLLLHQQYAHLIRKKHCYDNIWNLLLNNGIHEGQKICIGYVYCDPFYIRHAFLLDKDEIIDPTLPRPDQEYRIIAAFSKEAYLSHVASSRTADLIHDHSFMNMENTFVQICFQHEMLCIG